MRWHTDGELVAGPSICVKELVGLAKEADGW
jgi:hypothetical protein